MANRAQRRKHLQSTYIEPSQVTEVQKGDLRITVTQGVSFTSTSVTLGPEWLELLTAKPKDKQRV